MTPLRSPFPYFGGKSKAAGLIWSAFGDVANYIEPFAGSLAVMLARTTTPRVETINDADCYVANFWRATQKDPEAVARFADWPVNEIDLHARHLWLVNQGLFREQMRTDPEWFDPRVAGWWVWGICQWIGGGWCSVAPLENGERPWEQNKKPQIGGKGRGITAHEQRRPSLQRGKRGIDAHIERVWEPILALRGSRGAVGQGIHASGMREQMPKIGNSYGRFASVGMHGGYKKPVIGHRGHGLNVRNANVLTKILELAARLRFVRVCCGDWTRVLTDSATTSIGVTGVLLDPPYDVESTGRAKRLYSTDTAGISKAVRKWALEHGDDPKMRIALCGYEGEHQMPKRWAKEEWKANGGYAAAGGNPNNSRRERIWFSPHCAPARAQIDLFGA